ncbi:helix-turn-helix domain-containing protein [Pleurocapsa sp. FMAR1]|uniref:helix-turn-helix domain-containing protein n=1 Tax=Pleurocapsa sp. FMAR1 TaxID=3040204 RepID=UPI0039B07EAB
MWRSLTVRKAHLLNLDAIKGISDRHLKRIENEGQHPTLDALKKLAASHGLDLEDCVTQVN